MIAEAELCDTFPSEPSGRSGTSPWHYPQSRIAEVELHEDIPPPPPPPPTVELWNFVKIFPFEQRWGSGTLLWHYPQSEVREVALREDTSQQAMITEVELFEPFPSERSCKSRTLPWYYPQSWVAEEATCIPLRTKNFMKTFSSTVEWGNFVKTFHSECSCRSTFIVGLSSVTAV